MPAQSQAQRAWAFAVKGPAWAKEHHFDNKGPLPPRVKHMAHGGIAGTKGSELYKSRTSGIHINPAHKGEFTAKAKRAGMGVQAYASRVLANKDQYPTSTVRQANFARNAKGFSH
jgi:hypothetical protein